MKILSLDLSTKTGWALFENGKLNCYGQIKSDYKLTEEYPYYPRNYLQMSQFMASEIEKKVSSSNPDMIVIEETNKGKNRYSQKQLEFIHNQVIEALFKYDIHYMDTSEWRSILGISLDKDQRKDNREINDARKKEFDRVFNQHFDELNVSYQTELAGAKGKRDKNKILKKYQAIARTKTKERMRSFRFKEEGKVKGKVGTKQLSVNFVNETFSLKFKLKDNDIADAICVGYAFIIKKEYNKI
jgi:Holliday junction resolvasome RuvABC endonuclease subunit